MSYNCHWEKEDAHKNMKTLFDKRKQKKKSRYQCLKCPGQPALCIDQCFHLCHEKIGSAQTESSSESEQDWDYLIKDKRDLLILLMTWLYFYTYY